MIEHSLSILKPVHFCTESLKPVSCFCMSYHFVAVEFIAQSFTGMSVAYASIAMTVKAIPP